MKTIISTASVLLVCIAGYAAQENILSNYLAPSQVHFAELAPAPTNAPVVVTDTNITAAATNSDWQKYDLTLGLDGMTIQNHTEMDISFGLSSDPIKSLPNLWFGISQSVGWDPAFAGSTDVDADWSQNVWKNLYVNPGWSAGGVYATDAQGYWRTGPEVFFQWYTSDDAFIQAGVNYDFVSQGSGDFRYTIGIGIEF